jgi:hypothetical protein
VGPPVEADILALLDAKVSQPARMRNLYSITTDQEAIVQPMQ